MKNELKTIPIKEYLDGKGIKYFEANGELVTHCLFNGCDQDSRGKEAHLYFSAETGQYHCKKCDQKGNIITLAEFLGDAKSDVIIKENTIKSNLKKPVFDDGLVERCHQNLPEKVRQYLIQRGIRDEVINQHKLGWCKRNKQFWITIPIKNKEGKYIFFKLRQDPESGNEKMTHPSGESAQIYDWETAKNAADELVICEGELDCLLLLSNGVNAVTSTHGAGTFKEDWIGEVMHHKTIYLCFDLDEAGKKGEQKIGKMLQKAGHEDIRAIKLPDSLGKGGDITDYFAAKLGSVDDLFNKFTQKFEIQKSIDTSKLEPITASELVDILGITIKKDNQNKLLTLLCELSAYTEDSQLNISYNAPSSTGKSYIPTEIARLFPEKDVIEVAYCSPTAFFHDFGQLDKDKGGIIIDLSRKILIFLDQPHTQLLQHLRPLLSHDKKEIQIKITDKSQKGGIRTKNIFLKGFPAVIFCTAGLSVDEQEMTRFLMLSPETDQEKIREAVEQKILKECDPDAFKKMLLSNPKRKLLVDRIQAIKEEEIDEIKVAEPEKISYDFFQRIKVPKPRHSRDIGRILALVKVFALLNLWWREKQGNMIIANRYDIDEAFKLWEAISESQELNLPPYVYKIYKEVILPLWISNEKRGLARQDITKKHMKVYGRPLAGWMLRQQLLPMLEDVGLITQEPDPDDKRKMLIHLADDEDSGNSERGGGVKQDNSLFSF